MMTTQGPAHEEAPETLLMVEDMQALFRVKRGLEELQGANNGTSWMPYDDDEKLELRTEGRDMALKHLGHADHCLVAATRTLQGEIQGESTRR